MFALSAAILGTATVTATPTRPAVGTEWRRNDGMVSTHKKKEKNGNKKIKINQPNGAVTMAWSQLDLLQVLQHL
jgi:hypothetical protein